MSYTKNIWNDELLDGEERFVIKRDDDSIIADNAKIELKNTVIISGTPVNAENMNHIEQGIEDLSLNKLEKNDDVSETTVTFTEAEALINPATGDNQATLWGKILKLFNISSGHDHDGINSKSITYTNITNVPQFETSADNIQPDGIASAGNSGKIADAAHVHPQGIISVANGGTGRTILAVDNVLVGDGINQVKLIPIDEFQGGSGGGADPMEIFYFGGF